MSPCAVRCKRSALQQIQDVGPGAVSDHRNRSGRIAHVAGKQLAGQGNIHFRDDVVIGSRFVDDASEDGGSLVVAPYAPVEFSKAEVAK